VPAAELGQRPFSYALLRIVPRVERGERFNAGVVLFCREYDFLAVRAEVDEARLGALAPGVDPAPLRSHLEALGRVAAGDPSAGALARLEPSDRFGWLVAPSSTMIQPSEVHTGLTADPRATLDHLFQTLVASGGSHSEGERGVSQA
jgi:Protein of unknown function (DUF3037)